ncbi:MAG: hypothetical protein VX438_11635, partial [Planctomycetota bacterium]|nr:hypothetical protein [Planctomycetota bacterium]
MGADSNNRWKLASRHASHSAISSDLVPDDQIPPCVSNVILANSWILSLVFHLGLIVTLSLVSYTLQTGTEIELEFTSSSADAPTVTIESLETSDSKSGDNLDNEINQLLASSQRPLNLEINAASFEFDPVMSLQNTDGSNESTINATEGLLKSDSKIGNGNQAQFFGIQAKGKNFVFIVDSSSSMSGARWKNAVQELRSSLFSLQQNQKFYVIFFDHQT